MLSRQTLKFVKAPAPPAGEFTLEQRLAGRAASCSVWLKIIGFLLAYVLTNSFSLIGLGEEVLGMGPIIGICVIAAIGTIYANFISKTVVTCDPIDPLKLSTSQKLLYKRLETCMKINKDRHDCKEAFLVIDSDQLAQLLEAEVSIPALEGSKKKFEVAMHLLANRHGDITVLSPAEAMAQQAELREKRLIVAVTSDPSDDMLRFIVSRPSNAQTFNFDSYWEGVGRGKKCKDFWISLPRWTFIKALPSLVLVNQGITTVISLLNKIPGFGSAHWGIQIGTVAASALLVGWSRTTTNNVLKGDRAISEIGALAHTLSKWYRSCRNRPGDAIEQPRELQVSQAVAVAAILIACASVGLTVYYNYATASFYSPSQAADLLVKQLNSIPGIEKAPTALIDLGVFIKDIQCKVLYPGQIISSVVLAFLTTCKSTLDRVQKWLYDPAKTQRFCDKAASEQLFVVSNLIDSGTFGVNAAFNSNNIDHDKTLAILTGVGILLTSIVWGIDTKKIPEAHAIITCGNRPVLAHQSTLRAPLLGDHTGASSSGDGQIIDVEAKGLPAPLVSVVHDNGQRPVSSSSESTPTSLSGNRYRQFSVTQSPPSPSTLHQPGVSADGTDISHLTTAAPSDGTHETSTLRC